MKNQSVKQFAQEFNLRKQYTYSLRYLKLNRAKDLKAIRLILSN